jgi:predicted dehydrogenase
MSTTRRNFLITTAAGAAAAAPAVSARSYRNLLGSNDRIRMAVIGPGGMGRGHIGSFCNLRKQGKVAFDIVAVCDVCQTHLDAGLEMARNGQDGEVQVDGYRYYQELLARDDIDAVLIATTEHSHAAIAIAAVLAGKDVYCEKPMTLRLDQALEVYDTVMAQEDVVFQVGTQKMALNKYREARRLIKEGAIGKPLWSQTSYCRNTPSGEWNYYGIDPKVVPGEMLDWEAWLGHLKTDPKTGGMREFDTKVFHRWRRYKDFSTGIIGDLLVHEMTPLFFALDLDWPSRVDAIGGHYIDKEMENHDQVNLTVQFPEEHTMIVAGSTCNEQGLATTIRGHEGTIYLAGNNCEVRPERPYVDDHDPQVVECERIADQDYLRLNWLESIRDRKKPFSTVDVGAKVMVAVDLATRSMWENKAFTFDKETREVRAL